MTHFIIDSTFLPHLVFEADSSGINNARYNIRKKFLTLMKEGDTLIIPESQIFEIMGQTFPNVIDLIRSKNREKIRKILETEEFKTANSQITNLPKNLANLYESVDGQVKEEFEKSNAWPILLKNLEDKRISSCGFGSMFKRARRILLDNKEAFQHSIIFFIVSQIFSDCLANGSKTSNSFAAFWVLHTLLRYEHDTGYRCFPLRLVNAILGTNPDPHYQNILELKSARDMVDVQYIDFAIRGNWDANQRQSVTVLTCEKPERVKRRIAALESFYNNYNRWAKNAPSDKIFPLVKFKKGSIRCYDSQYKQIKIFRDFCYPCF